jgi:hypothetical protein
MRARVAIVVVASALLLGAADVHAMASGGGHGRGNGSKGTTVASGSKRSSNPLPEPSTFYAVTTSLAVLSGASWYIRRRK